MVILMMILGSKIIKEARITRDTASIIILDKA